MKKEIAVTLLITITCGIFQSCTDTVSTREPGGTGTETINTFAMLPCGSPAAGATAQIIDARWWYDSVAQQTSPVICTAVADANGHIEICFSERDDLINLQIDHQAGGILVPLPVQARNNIDTTYLESYATYSGNCSNTATAPDYLLLTGTDYKVPVNESGIFLFQKVAPGPYAVLGVSDLPTSARTTLGISLTLQAGTTVENQTLETADDRVLIDNFESGVGPTSLGRIFPVLGWYILSDSLYYSWEPETAAWTFIPTTAIGQSPIYGDSVADGNGGTAFNFSTILDPISYYANALIGFSLKPLSKTGVDLSGMTGFSLRAGGKGTIRVRFESAGLDSISILSHYSYVIELSDTMASYRVPVDSLTIIEPIINANNYPWKQESKKIIRIEFEFSTNNNDRSDSLYCTLDDFYLEGISVESLHTPGPD